MVTHITSSTYRVYLQNPTSILSFAPFPPLVLVLRPQKKVQIFSKAVVLESRKGGYFGGFEAERVSSESSFWCCRCIKGYQSEGDSELEGKILEFMENSDKPGRFPTKQELVDAGRLDLVDAISSRGGWFSLGWEVNDGENERDKVKESEIRALHIDVKEFKRRVESCKDGGGSMRDDRVGSSGVNSFSGDSAPLASSSGRSLEMVTEEEIGVEGILNRLKKERNSSFGVTVGKYGNGRYSSSKVFDDDDKRFGSLQDVDRTNLGENGRPMLDGPNLNILHNHYTRPDMWRAWSDQRAGFQNTAFEAAEIFYDGNRDEREGRKSDIVDTTETISRKKEINCDQIRSRLHDLEVELSSALRSLTSNREESFLKEVSRNTSSEFQRLSDAWEFQENEIMAAQERLRSIRAKLAVLEGKMALAIIDAKKTVEEKQRRIEGSHKALQLLRTARIVWPNPASEVLLAGSFDGWTTQRKMEKSSSGIFSVYLKLYPGRYEIKFIVDGIWRVDPLRPIISNSGYDNNLLIIT